MASFAFLRVLRGTSTVYDVSLLYDLGRESMFFAQHEDCDPFGGEPLVLSCHHSLVFVLTFMVSRHRGYWERSISLGDALNKQAL